MCGVWSVVNGEPLDAPSTATTVNGLMSIDDWSSMARLASNSILDIPALEAWTDVDMENAEILPSTSDFSLSACLSNSSARTPQSIQCAPQLLSKGYHGQQIATNQAGSKSSIFLHNQADLIGEMRKISEMGLALLRNSCEQQLCIDDVLTYSKSFISASSNLLDYLKVDMGDNLKNYNLDEQPQVRQATGRLLDTMSSISIGSCYLRLLDGHTYILNQLLSYLDNHADSEQSALSHKSYPRPLSNINIGKFQLDIRRQSSIGLLIKVTKEMLDELHTTRKRLFSHSHTSSLSTGDSSNDANQEEKTALESTLRFMIRKEKDVSSLLAQIKRSLSAG